jgi:hypothetical protein
MSFLERMLVVLERELEVAKSLEGSVKEAASCRDRCLSAMDQVTLSLSLSLSVSLSLSLSIVMELLIFI